MKRLFSISALFIILFLSAVQIGLTSCTKEIIRETVKKDTVMVKDTIVIKDTILSTQILTANGWKMQELRGVLGGMNRYYLRGGTNNTESFDNEYIVFRADNTGTYYENGGKQDAFTWGFANAENTKILLTIYNTPATYQQTWDNIRYKNKSLYFDNYYRDGNTGLYEHSQQIRTPK